MAIELKSSKNYPGRIDLSHRHSPESNMTTTIALTWEDLEELAHTAQQVLGLPANAAPVEAEFLPNNPGDSSPYFYHVTDDKLEAQAALYKGGKLMRRFVTSWEEVK